MISRARILLVDDHELFREGVAKVINSEPDMEIIGQADDGFEALTMARELHPDLILMDISMPMSNGLEATALIHANMPDILIIMLTIYEEEEKLFDAIKSGATGYILKTSSCEGLVRGIRSALEGEASVPRKLATQLLVEFSKLSKRSGNFVGEEAIQTLSQRELEVLNIMAAGVSNQEIADTLSISLQTVKSHVSNILAKLHAKSRLQATELGIKHGFIQHKYNEHP